MNQVFDILKDIIEVVKSVAIAIALPVLTGLGFLKLYIEPRVEAKDNIKKYATALYIACKEYYQGRLCGVIYGSHR